MKLDLFVQLEVDYNWNPNSSLGVERVRFLRATVNPVSVAEDCNRVVRVTLDIPDEMLLPLEVTATPDQAKLMKEAKAFLEELDEHSG